MIRPCGVFRGELHIVRDSSAQAHTFQPAWSSACWRVMRSLASRCRSDDAMKIWMRFLPAASTARAARFDVASLATRQRRDAVIRCNLAGNRLHAGEVAVGGDGKASLNDVHARGSRAGVQNATSPRGAWCSPAIARRRAVWCRRRRPGRIASAHESLWLKYSDKDCLYAVIASSEVLIKQCWLAVRKRAQQWTCSHWKHFLLSRKSAAFRGRPRACIAPSPP